MFISESQYIGFDTGKSSLRIAKVRKTHKGWDVPLIKELSSSDHVNLLYKHLREGLPVSTVQTRDVLFRYCEMPLKKPKQIFEALDFHVEPLLPYALDKAVIQAQITEQQEHTTSLTVSAVRKDHLSLHLDQLKKYSVEPEVVTSKAHAFAALTQLLPPSELPMLIVHEGEDEMTMVLVEKGQIVAVRAADLRKDVGAEIQKTLLSLSTSHKTKIFESIYFFGKDPAIKQALATASGKSVLAPTSPFLTLTQDELIQYGLAIGCAMAHKSINFRQKEFAYPYPFRRFKRPLAVFFCLSLIFTLSLCAFSEIILINKKQALATAYNTLLQGEGKSANSTPKTPDEYLASLERLEQEVRARPERFPLLPQVPKVKELLSWLASVPGGQGVVVESLNYQMVKRPEFSNRHEKYKVRVDLELSAPDANSARRFQECLKQAGPVVDATEEVQWFPVKGKYKASFFLKDKTKYE